MRPWVVPAAVAALFITGAVWFFAKFERVPDKEWVGPSAAAQRDPFLAAQRLAGRMGMPSRPVRTLPELDRLAPAGVLLLAAGRQAIDPRRLRHIVSWAEQGGHLIAEAELQGVSDPLFDQLGVQRRSGERAFKAPPVETAEGRKLKVSLSGRTVLQLPPGEVRFSAGAQDEVVIAALERGRGTVTVASSLAFARNGLIGTDDNAELFWYLLELTPAKELQVYLRQERLSLWGFLKQHAAPVVLAAAALLLAWLWRIGPRFGPVLPDAPPARRRLLDHLRASGRYFWTKGLRSRLVVAARDAALRRISRAQPDFAAASAAERARRLASLAGISLEESQKFLTAAGAMRGIEFIKVTQQAQRVHSALEKGAK
jgi:hypothetical protein